MRAVAGVFQSRETARRAAEELLRAGFARDRVTVLYPGAGDEPLKSLPNATEQHGAGAAIGGVLGTAIGLVGGFELGIGVTALIPGVGPVLAAGVAAAAVLGAGGLISGAQLGSTAEGSSTEGLPPGDVFYYEETLREGRSLVVLLARDEEEARRGREVLGGLGGESIEAVREAWWRGLRDEEARQYRATGRNIEQDQPAYRAGFEAALRRECQGKTLNQAAGCLREQHPDLWDSAPFRRGFERGRAYLESHLHARA